MPPRSNFTSCHSDSTCSSSSTNERSEKKTSYPTSNSTLSRSYGDKNKGYESQTSVTSTMITDTSRSSLRSRVSRRLSSTDLENGSSNTNRNQSAAHHHDETKEMEEWQPLQRRRRRKRMTPHSKRISTSFESGQPRNVAERQPTLLLPITWTLPVLVVVDMLAVSLVVPLLFQYYKAAGVTSASQRELLSAFFSAAQIVGGVTLGVLKDALGVSSRTLFLASFVGSALSYGLIAYSTTLSSEGSAGLFLLMLSRVLVGFVKQTMTVSTTLLTTVTSKHDRAKYMGRLTASSTVAWIVGPSVGALLYKYIHPQAPALLASALFVLNIVLVTILLPMDDSRPPTPPTHQNSNEQVTDSEDDTNELTESSSLASFDSSTSNSETSASGNTNVVSQPPTAWARITSNLHMAFGSRELAAVVLARLLLTFCAQVTNVARLGSFYEDFYQLQSHHRGYLSSYQQVLLLGVQAFLVHPVLNMAGGDTRTTAYVLCFGLVLVNWLQSVVPVISFYLVVICPLSSLCMAMMKLSLETLTTQVAPHHAMFSVLAALDVLQNIVGVSVPFYRTILFRFLAKDGKDELFMEGDPDPQAWIVSSSCHWLVAAIAMTALFACTQSSSSPPSIKTKGG